MRDMPSFSLLLLVAYNFVYSITVCCGSDDSVGIAGSGRTPVHSTPFQLKLVVFVTLCSLRGCLVDEPKCCSLQLTSIDDID